MATIFTDTQSDSAAIIRLISKYPLLTLEEEAEYTRIIHLQKCQILCMISNTLTFKWYLESLLDTNGVPVANILNFANGRFTARGIKVTKSSAIRQINDIHKLIDKIEYTSQNIESVIRLFVYYHEHIPSWTFLEDEGVIEKSIKESSNKRTLNALMREFTRNTKIMTNHNLRLVFSLAVKYKGDLLDSFQNGSIGLLRAVKRFDPTLGFKFSTFAVWWIKQCIAREHLNTQMIRIPIHIYEKIRKVQETRGKFSVTDPSEIAKITGYSLHEVHELLIHEELMYTESLNQDVGEDLSSERITLIVDETNSEDPFDSMDVSAIHEEIRRLLSPFEYEIIARRNGFEGYTESTLEEIGMYFHLTRERIRQIEKQASRRLLLSPLLKSFATN